MLLVLIADNLKGRYRAEFKLALSELFVERSKKTPSLKSASLSTRRFAAYAYFFEVAWRSNLDNHSRDRARAYKTRGFHCRLLEPGKYATEIRGPRHIQLYFCFVHKLRQTELTKEGQSNWRLWPLRPAVSYTRDGTDWPKVAAVEAQQPISDFFGVIYSNARHAIKKRRTSPGSWSQELSSHTNINEIRQRRPKWHQFKKVVSLAGLHHT